MDSVPASALKHFLRSHALWVAVVVLVVWIVGTRWMLRNEPLDRDISAYAVVGREILNDRPLYSDLWDHKPPGIHLIFAGATVLVGPGVPAVLLVNVAFSVLTFVGLMVAGHRVAGKSGAILAGSLWVFVGADLGLQANQPNVELPMNACVAWAMAASLSWRSRLAGTIALTTGGLTAGGLLLKMVVAAPLGFLAAVDVAEIWWRKGPRNTAAFLVRWGFAVMCGVVPVMAWCVFSAGGEAVWDALVRYNLAYRQSTMLSSLQEFLRVGNHLPTSSIAVIGLLSLAGVAGLTRLDSPGRRRILAVILGSAVAVAAPGRFHPHYYQLFLPPLVLASAVGFQKFLIRPGVLRFAAITVLAALGLIHVHYLRLPPDEWSRRKYGDEFLDERRLAGCVSAYVKPGDCFWQLGPQPGIYLLTETVPASGVIYDYPLLPRSPVRNRLAGRVIAELTENPPGMVLVRTNDLRKVDSRINAWIRLNYQPATDGCPVRGFVLWSSRSLNSGENSQIPASDQVPITIEDFEDGTSGVWMRFPANTDDQPTQR
ncbi:MAG: hypothetical protein P8127_04720 [Acidobacteriota bacterium]